MSGLLIAAPASGSGKTTVTLGLLRALRDIGHDVAPGKAGPDYIDPAFHAAASAETCLNFDPWAMRREFLLSQAEIHGRDRLLVVEAMMGLFDAAADGTGSPADLAALLGLSVVLVVDCARMSQSVAALVSGYRDFRKDVHVAGVILNRVGSDRHDAMLRRALEAADITIYGSLSSDPALKLPERHLGLVQAGEHGELENFIGHAASMVKAHCNVDALADLSKSGEGAHALLSAAIPPLGQRIAVAQDTAFAFLYPHLLDGWRKQGAEILPFSPMADEAPKAGVDAVFLPGGYPELHAGRLSSASVFKRGMLDLAAQGAVIYGECGGFMVLGDGLVDGDGVRHEMLGLLPLETTFARRMRHLGYRRVRPVDGSFFEKPMTAHEFHYSSVAGEGRAERLFLAEDALGCDLGAVGLRRDNVAGSYLHVIDLSGERP